MKTLIAALLLFLMAGPLWAGQTVISFTGTGAADKWFYSAGSDTYAGTDTDTRNTYGWASAVTPSACTSITKVGFKAATGGATAISLALYTGDTTAMTLRGQCTTSDPAVVATGWNDCTLTSPYAWSSGAVVVWYMFSGNNVAVHATSASTGTSYYKAVLVFANFPYSPSIGGSSTFSGAGSYATRVWCE